MPAEHVLFDFERSKRTGLEEVILCEGKSAAQLAEILARAMPKTSSLLLTRLEFDLLNSLPPEQISGMDYDPESRTGIMGTLRSPDSGCRVAVVSGGSSDVPVAREAVRTLRYFGALSQEIYDVGVAGLWRLLDRVEELRTFPVVIVVAGMDGALPTVVAGLVPSVVIAVPRSTGYGMARHGETALAAVLTSCAPGITVVNIDNGFGAACAALRCLRSVGAGLNTA